MKHCRVLLLIYSILLCLMGELVAQKIQIKDGTIVKDKKPIARLEGKAALGEILNLKILSLEGAPQVVLTEKVARYNSFFYKDTYFTSVEIPTLNKKFYRIEMHDWASEKKIIKFLFDEIGEDFISENGINQERITTYIPKGDQAEAIKNDTLKFKELVAGFHRALSQHKQVRQPYGKIEFRDCDKKITKWDWYVDKGSNYNGREFFQIYYNEVEVGVLIKTFCRVIVGGENYCLYFVLKKVDPFKINDYEDIYVPLSYLDTSTDVILDPKFFVERVKDTTAPKYTNAMAAETSLVTFLINSGHL